MTIEWTKKSILVIFSSPRRVLSSAPYSGGMRETDLIINLRTSARQTRKNSPQSIISEFLRERGLSENTVGFLTAAQLEYSQFILRTQEDIKLLSIVTAGTSNALNIADRAPTLYSGESMPYPGTINIILVTNAELLEDCYVSAVVSATEAKSGALFDLQIKSVLSGRQATGTGTDAVAVVSGRGRKIQYAGGHTQFGQLIGDAVYTGVTRALSRRRMKPHKLEQIQNALD
jgi:adenosylcobinamide hydrolase